jgi:histidyl-tRNA synthetase
MGVERVLELLKEQDGALKIAPLDAYAVVSEVSDLPRVSAYLQTLRALGVSIQMHASADGAMASIKSQFKKADASGARYVLVFGVDELAQGCVTIKSLRDASQAQQLEPLSQLPQWAEHLQSKA